MRCLIVSAAVFFSLLASASTASTAEGLSEKEIERRVHAQILDRAPQYVQKRRDKALAGCINWANSTLNRIDVRHLYFIYTGAGSDAPVFPSRLMWEAVRRCDGLRAEHGSDCTCVEIDKMGRSVLDIPSSFIEQARIIPPIDLGADPYRVIFTTKLNEEKKPVDDLKIISIDAGHFTIFVNWEFDITKINSGFVRYSIYDGNGDEVKYLVSHIFPKSEYWNTWVKVPMDPLLNAPGQWRAEVYFDDNKLAVKHLTVTP